jgi:hypothetical protein
MPFVALALLLLLPLAVIALMPLILIQRYRVGRARRLARPWMATLNVLVMLFSATFFVLVAAAITAWVPGVFRAALLGLLGGCAAGLLGVFVSRWEATPASLHYTPNRWLVLAITHVVAVRVLYGFWRSWNAWQWGADDESLLAAFGVAGSVAAAGIVIGYYLAFSVGVRRRISTWQRRPLRTIR